MFHNCEVLRKTLYIIILSIKNELSVALTLTLFYL